MQWKMGSRLSAMAWLLAFVGLQASTPAAAQPAAPAFYGPWEMERLTSGIDGARYVRAMLLSSNQIRNQIDMPEAAGLAVRCAGGAIALYINWPRYIGLESAAVAWRLDAEPAQYDRWSISSTGTGTGLFERRTDDARALAAAMARSRHLSARVYLSPTVSIEAEFDLTGSDKAVGEVLAACPLY